MTNIIIGTICQHMQTYLIHCLVHVREGWVVNDQNLQTFQTSDTTRFVTLTCLFTWSSSQCPIVTSFTMLFLICYRSLVTQKVNERRHDRVTHVNYPNHFCSNDISASCQSRSRLFIIPFMTLIFDRSWTIFYWAMISIQSSPCVHSWSRSAKLSVTHVPHAKRFYNAGIMCCSNQSDPVIKSSSACTPSMPSSDSPRRDKNVMGWIYDSEMPTYFHPCGCSIQNAPFKGDVVQFVHFVLDFEDGVRSNRTVMFRGREAQNKYVVVCIRNCKEWYDDDLVSREMMDQLVGQKASVQWSGSGVCDYHRLLRSIEECRRSVLRISSHTVRSCARELKLHCCRVSSQ